MNLGWERVERVIAEKADDPAESIRPLIGGLMNKGEIQTVSVAPTIMAPAPDNHAPWHLFEDRDGKVQLMFQAWGITDRCLWDLVGTVKKTFNATGRRDRMTPEEREKYDIEKMESIKIREEHGVSADYLTYVNKLVEPVGVSFSTEVSGLRRDDAFWEKNLVRLGLADFIIARHKFQGSEKEFYSKLESDPLAFREPRESHSFRLHADVYHDSMDRPLVYKFLGLTPVVGGIKIL